jgi:predicted MarR family transcription regulator
VTLLRGVGGSLGTAVFGAIFTNRLTSQLTGGGLPPALKHIVAGGGRLTGRQVGALPPAARTAYEQAYVHALSPVFLVAGGIVVVGFALSFLLPEHPLRATAATSRGLDDALAAPKSPDSLAEMERALVRCTDREEREAFRARMAERAGIDLSPGATWALVRMEEFGARAAHAAAREHAVGPERVEAVLADLEAQGFVTRGEDGAALTPLGTATGDRLLAARRDLLSELVAEERADRPPELEALIRRLSRELVGERP